MPSIFLFSGCARIKCNTFTYISNVWIYQCHYHFLMLPSCYHTHHHRHCAKIYRYNKTEKANVISIDLMVFRCCGIRSIRTYESVGSNNEKETALEMELICLATSVFDSFNFSCWCSFSHCSNSFTPSVSFFILRPKFQFNLMFGLQERERARGNWRTFLKCLCYSQAPRWRIAYKCIFNVSSFMSIFVSCSHLTRNIWSHAVV